MAHWSETAKRLTLTRSIAYQIEQLRSRIEANPQVFLLWLPSHRSPLDPLSQESQKALKQFAFDLHPESVLCLLTSPSTAARLLLLFENSLKFQLWIPVKRSNPVSTGSKDRLAESHAELVVLTRYRSPLRHTKTRIQ